MLRPILPGPANLRLIPIPRLFTKPRPFIPTGHFFKSHGCPQRYVLRLGNSHPCRIKRVKSGSERPLVVEKGRGEIEVNC